MVYDCCDTWIQGEMYTVKRLSKLAGVSVRTLHYYDEIGLLKPSMVGKNGYRYYGEKALLCLQQILFYRELDLSLKEIKSILQSPDFDVKAALLVHKQALGRRVERLHKLIQTVDNTIIYLKGAKEMSQRKLFEAFSEEEQEKYAREAEQMYDPEVVKESNRKWKAFSPVEKQHVLDEGNVIYADLLNAMPKGADSSDVQAIIERWRKHMSYFWTPNLDQLASLAEMYNKDARFKANFDKVDPKLAEFMLEAVRVYVKSRSERK